MKARQKTIRSGALIAGCFGIVVIFCVFMQSDISAQVINNTASRESVISITAGQSHVIKAPWPTIRVAVTDPKVADVQILTPTQVLLQGLNVGSTDLILWNEDETQVWQTTVHVTLDIAVHEQKLHNLFPRCTLELDQSGDVLIVRGLLRSIDQAAQLHDYLEKSGVLFVDMTSIAGVQQVQLEIRVAEVTRKALRTLAINTIYADRPFFGLISPTPSSGTPLISSINLTNDYFSTTYSASSAVTLWGGVPRANFDMLIQALAENQYLRILANPTLVALSGEEASFLAGGEFPIPVVQSGAGGGTGGTSITIVYKEFGVRLTFRPTVLGDGTIKLYTAPEVSELTSIGSVAFEGFEIPGITTRRAETTLELKSGQTFAMAGLIRSNVNAINAKIPGIGDLPVLGPLFRSVRYQNEETELVVLVTASLVEPLSIVKKPPMPGFLHTEPNDWEFYIEGRIEGQEPAKLNSADADWLRQMGMDELIGPGAWDYYNNPIVPSQADIEPTASNIELEENKKQE